MAHPPHDSHAPALPATPLSRRDMLRRCTLGVGAAAVAPVLLPRFRGAAPLATRDLARRASTPGAGLHGATLSLSAFPHGTTWAQAISTWQGYTGTTIAVAKAYYGKSVFPTAIGSEINAYIKGGIKAVLSFKPTFRPVSHADMDAMANTLTMYKNAGLQADVALWQEAQNVMTAAEYKNCVHFYGKTIQEFYPLAYDVSGSAGPANWQSYYPGDNFIDIIAVDYYAQAFVTKTYRLDTIVGIADNSKKGPKPFAIWEMGNSPTKTSPTQAQMQSYFAYIQSLMSGRLQAGKVNGDIIWYNGGVNVIGSSSDFRVPLWDSLVSATS